MEPHPRERYFCRSSSWAKLEPKVGSEEPLELQTPPRATTQGCPQAWLSPNPSERAGSGSWSPGAAPEGRTRLPPSPAASGTPPEPSKPCLGRDERPGSTPGRR